MIQFIENLMSNELYFLIVTYAALNTVVQLLFIVTVLHIGRKIKK